MIRNNADRIVSVFYLVSAVAEGHFVMMLSVNRTPRVAYTKFRGHFLPDGLLVQALQVELIMVLQPLQQVPCTLRDISRLVTAMKGC